METRQQGRPQMYEGILLLVRKNKHATVRFPDKRTAFNRRVSILKAARVMGLRINTTVRAEGKEFIIDIKA
jgi:hypothetical protein